MVRCEQEGLTQPLRVLEEQDRHVTTTMLLAGRGGGSLDGAIEEEGGVSIAMEDEGQSGRGGASELSDPGSDHRAPCTCIAGSSL